MAGADKRFGVLGVSYVKHREAKAARAAGLNSANFTDTGQSGTRAQVETYNRLSRAGLLDGKAAPGSVSNPYGQRLNSSIPEGSHYIDLWGAQKVAPEGGAHLTGPRNITAGMRPPVGSAPKAERMTVGAQPFEVRRTLNPPLLGPVARSLPGDIVPNHAFGALIDPRSREIFLNYSSGPDRDPGKNAWHIPLGGTGAPTDQDDRRSLQRPDRWDTELRPIPTSVPSFIEAGEEISNFLRREPVRYPWYGFLGGDSNSNWYTSQIANQAIQADHPGAPSMKMDIWNPHWDDAPPQGAFPDWKKRR